MEGPRNDKGTGGIGSSKTRESWKSKGGAAVSTTVEGTKECKSQKEGRDYPDSDPFEETLQSRHVCGLLPKQGGLWRQINTANRM